MDLLKIAKLTLFFSTSILLLTMSFCILKINNSVQQIKIEQINQAVDNLNTTLNTINRPCGTKINGYLQPCGTLADVNKSVTDIGDITISIQRQTENTVKEIDTYGKSINVITSDIHSEFSSLNKATLQSTELMNAGTNTLNNIGKTVNQTQPLITNLNQNSIQLTTDLQTVNQNLQSLNNLLSNSDLVDTLHQTDLTMKNINNISNNVSKKKTIWAWIF